MLVMEPVFPAILILLLFGSPVSASTGVCYSSTVARWAYYSYYSYCYSYSYYYSCGWCGWSRCTGYSYAYAKATQYNPTTYKSYSYCCSGYSGSAPYNCNPVCSQGCVHGTCTSPGTCTCSSGWSGNNCNSPVCSPSCVNGYCSNPNTCTCNSGWEGSICNDAICNPECVHGSCDSPDKCTCDSGWTGSICRDDSSLTNWCSSISNYNINNTFLDNVGSDLTVYCDSNDHKYQENHTSDVAPKILADFERSKHLHTHSLYQLWRQHPYVRDFCCYSNSNYHITLLDNLLEFNSDFYDYVGGVTATVAIELRKELTVLCSSSLSDPFCPIKAALDIIDLAARLPESKSEWTAETTKHKEAILVSAAVLKRDHPEEYSNLEIFESDYLVKSTDIIIEYMQEMEIEKLKTFVTHLPPSDAYKAGATSCDSDNLCIFMKMVEQVRVYLDEAEFDSDPFLVNEKRRLILNTETDYHAFLREEQLDTILTTFANKSVTSTEIGKDLKKHASTQYTELKSYFAKIVTFNEKISSADVEFINKRNNHYQKKIDQIIGDLKEDVASILHKATNAAGLSVDASITTAATDVADCINPLGTLFGVQTLEDIESSADDFVSTLTRNSKAKKLSTAYKSLKVMTIEICTKLEMNGEFLQDVLNLLDRDTVSSEKYEMSKRCFIDKYKDYVPQIVQLQISEMASYWDSVITSACNVIERHATDEEGLCESTPDLAKEMISLYEEMYGYQFELIDAMAAYIRSTVALDGASEIKEEFAEVAKLDVDSKSTLTTLKIIGGLSYTTYKAHILQAVHLYCNVLEYMEGGKKPSDCEGVDTDISRLLANIEPVCVSSAYRYYYAPTTPSDDCDMAHVNLTKLFSGSEVTFKIPSSQWLIDNHWIHEVEKDYAFYVKKFELFLPTTTEYPLTMYATADPILHNAVLPNSTDYIIIPHRSFLYEYLIGPAPLTCRQQNIRNPYTFCDVDETNEVCQYSQMTKWPIYPSIYSQWTLKIKGAERLTEPNPATSISVMFGIQLCKIAPDDYVREDLVRLQAVAECCPAAFYRSNITSGCTPCPIGSRSALAGYYCEKYAN